MAVEFKNVNKYDIVSKLLAPLGVPGGVVGAGKTVTLQDDYAYVVGLYGIVGLEEVKPGSVEAAEANKAARLRVERGEVEA